MASALENRHLAELHGLADELGVEGFRMLSKQDLVAAILERDPDAEDKLPAAPEPDPDDVDDGDRASSAEAERNQARGRGGSGRGRSRGGGRRPREEEPAEGEDEADAGEPVTGVLDITPRGHGFIRLSGLGSTDDDDVYVSPSQIRRCEMQRGDEISGPARRPRRGERYPALVHVDAINGVEPGEGRPRLADATPVRPSRRIELAAGDVPDADAVTLRAIDLLAPLAHGQRVLVRAAPGAGRTTLLRALGRALAPREEIELVVLLIDERPEELEDWREAVPGADLAVATADMRSGEQLRLVELALGRVARRAEAGADVVLLVDSLSRIAAAADEPGRVKPIFGAGRETAEEGIGSLTVIATVLADADDEGGVERAVATTESSLIALDRDLAAAGTFPPLALAAFRITGGEELRDEADLAAVRALRGELAALPPAEAVAELRRRIEGSPDNRALLDSLAG